MSKYDKNPLFDDYDKQWHTKAHSLDKEEWAKGYDQAFTADIGTRGWVPLQPGRQRVHFSQVQAIVWNRASRAKSVLDFGCGPGFLTATLNANGNKAIGVDCSHEAILFARSHFDGKFRDSFSVATEDEVAELTEKFEVVCAVEVLEHVKDPEKTMRILWDRVEDGGALIITVPKDGCTPSPYHIHEFHYEHMVDLARTVAEPDVGPQYVADIESTEREYILTVKKEPLLIKYVQLQGRTHLAQIHNDIISSTRVKTGIYNWSNIFNGTAEKFETCDPFQYDVIHIQLAGDNFDAPRQIREKIGPKGQEGAPKLIVNLDYAPEFWNQYPPYYEMMVFQLEQADVVFAQNDRTAAILSGALGFGVPVVPHPVDTVGLAEVRKTWDERDKDNIAVHAHRDYNLDLPMFIFRGLDVRTQLFNYSDPGAGSGRVTNAHFHYNEIHPPMACEDYIKMVNDCGISVDTYTHSVQGRATMEMAALGIPNIGGRQVDAQQRCFPALATEVNDVATQRRLLERLMDDGEFYLKTVATAVHEVEHYNFENSKQRFLGMIDYDNQTTTQARADGNGRVDQGSEVGTPVGGSEGSPLILPA